MNYTVLERFFDTKDNHKKYIEGMEYPRKGAPSFSKDEDRIKWLQDRGYISKEPTAPKKEVKEDGKKL